MVISTIMIDRRLAFKVRMGLEIPKYRLNFEYQVTGS